MKPSHIILPTLFILFIWWFVKKLNQKEETTKPLPEIIVPKDISQKDNQSTTTSTSKTLNLKKTNTSDDLTLIKGIGSKISSALNNNGINSFNKLAKSNPDEISAILEQNNIRAGNIYSWIEQAKSHV